MEAATRAAFMDGKACYAAFRAHDSRFDGRFFIGVSSTGVYCRPVCRVKMPKEENCSYYPSAAAAEAAGYRPCLKCRPELAPGLAPVDAACRLARKAALVMEEDCLCDGSIASLANALGVTDRHLRRVFSAEFGVSPLRYLQTRRLLLAKSLLTDTSLSVAAVALSAGFGSIRRFNELFGKRYRMTPGAFRKLKGDGKGERGDDCVALRLGYRPPYRWEEILSFLAGRAIPGVESVANGAYRRAVLLRTGESAYRGWIAVRNDEQRNSLVATVSSSLLPLLPRVLSRVRGLFDLDCDPVRIFETLSTMNDLRPGMCAPGTRLPGCFDSFEMAVRAVLGQQITVKAARTLAARLAAAYGGCLETPFDDVNRTFPEPGDVLGLPGPIESNLGPLGVIGARARSIRALADALSRGTVRLSRTADPLEEMSELLKLPGFGPWTVHYLAMRALGWPDAFPHTDYGVKKALGGMTQKEILALSETWRPWRSYAVVNLWNAPDEP